MEKEKIPDEFKEEWFDYIDEEFKPCFELECHAIKKVRGEMGLKNVQVMVPFIRTISEAEQVVSLLADNGLIRGKDELKLIMMCELPSNALMAEEFLKYFDIPSNSADAYSLSSEGFSSVAKSYGKMGGLDRIATVVKSIRSERPNALLLDGGDTWQGSYTALKTNGMDMVKAFNLL